MRLDYPAFFVYNNYGDKMFGIFRKIKKEEFEKFLEKPVIKSDNKIYDFRYEDDKKVYLFKCVRISPSHEVIITNKYYWIDNDNIKEYKRSKKPNLINGVKELKDYIYETEKKVIKVGVIYPFCHNIIMYINESDVVKVDPKRNCYGNRMVMIDDVKEVID